MPLQPLNLFVPEGTADRIVIMAPGPSLSPEQVKATQGIFCITIGDAYLLNPFAEILYHCDERWWNYYKGVPDFYGCQRVSLETVPKHPEVRQVIKSTLKRGIDRASPNVVTGGNSGYQAINLAYHFKPKEIILLGYDMKKAANGKYNVRGDHPPEVKVESNFANFIDTMQYLLQPLAAAGIKVYNCTTDTDLTCFPRRDLADVL